MVHSMQSHGYENMKCEASAPNRRIHPSNTQLQKINKSNNPAQNTSLHTPASQNSTVRVEKRGDGRIVDTAYLIARWGL